MHAGAFLCKSLMVIAAENVERGGCRKMTSGELEPQPKFRLRLRRKWEVMPNDYAAASTASPR
jgi:hypothetical protein